MPKVLGIHGIGQQFDGPYSISALWLPALNNGLHFAGACPPLESDDFQCAFFGNLFRGEDTKGEDIEIDFHETEEQLIDAFWRESNRLDETLPTKTEVTKNALHRVVHIGLEVLVSTPVLRTLACSPSVVKLIFRKNLRQVRDYLFDPSIRQEVQASFKQLLTADTRVVVSHSLGSIVAYECLFDPRASGVTTFVTLGSPLGIDRPIFRRLLPSPEEGRGRFPPYLRTWVNIAEKNDFVALTKRLKTKFAGHINDYIVDNGDEPHSALRYLSSKACGQAISLGI